MRPEIRNLPFHPDVAILPLQIRTHRSHQIPHRPGAPLRRTKTETELIGRSHEGKFTPVPRTVSREQRTRKVELLAQSPNHIHQNRKHNAHHNRSRQRKIESRILPTINNVPRKPPNRKISPAEQNEHQSDNHNGRTQKHQHFAQVRHSKSLTHSQPLHAARNARICSHEMPPDLPRTLTRCHCHSGSKYFRGRTHRRAASPPRPRKQICPRVPGRGSTP